MSNEEQAVLDFFAQAENLPLALSVADQVDVIRQRMNNAFWRDLHARLAVLLELHRLPWALEITEDRNSQESMVGVNLSPLSDQALFLRLMMEQQYIGDNLRIYYGAMWSSQPASEQTRLVAVARLAEALRLEGFKNNESFLGWNWTSYHPRRRDFLQRYSNNADALLDEACGLLGNLLLIHGDALIAANKSLAAVPRSMAVSLDQLHTNITRHQE